MKLILAMALFLGWFTGMSIKDGGLAALLKEIEAISIGHGLLIGFVIFASFMAKRQTSKTFLGADSMLWPIATAIGYIIGFVLGIAVKL